MAEELSKPLGKKSETRMTSLQVANAMYQEAFLVKRTRFALEFPLRSGPEIDRMTAQYFAGLPSSPE